jgi:hypothetical protein
MTKMYAAALGLRSPVALIRFLRISLKRHSTQPFYEVRFIDSGKWFKLDKIWWVLTLIRGGA